MRTDGQTKNQNLWGEINRGQSKMSYVKSQLLLRTMVKEFGS